MVITDAIRDAIRAAIEKSGSSLCFSRSVGVTHTTVSYWLSGRTRKINSYVWQNLLPVISEYLDSSESVSYPCGATAAGNAGLRLRESSSPYGGIGRTSGNVTADVCSTLFGSTAILTLSLADVWICVAMSVIVIAIFLIFYNKIFAVTFDESFAKATGVRSDLYNLLIAVVIAIIIVIAMNFVGSLLISALIIFPALSAMRVFKSFRSVIICSVIISLLCAFFGIIISILAGTPVGATIVIADIIVFFTFCLTSFVLKRGK